MADRIVIIKDGRIRQVGTPEEIYHSPANTFFARFIGAPSMNVIKGAAAGGTVTLVSGGSIGLDRGRGEVLPGVRPDDLRPVTDAPLIEGRVILREPLGPETLIYIVMAAGEIIAKADGRTPPAVGEVVRLGASARDAHLFDRSTGAALT